MLPQWIIKCVQFAVHFNALFGYTCAARNQYGTISVVGQAFMNREVTLKATPFYPWECDLEWRYLLEGGTQFQTMTLANTTRYSEDGSFILKWNASIQYNKSYFYAGCITNQTIKTSITSLHMIERPSYPVLGPKSADFNTTECIYVYGDSDIYCTTENGTAPVLVELLIGQNAFVLAESKGNKGWYLFSNVHQQMDGLSRLNVTCQVSNAALQTPYEVHGILCSVERGSTPVLTLPEHLNGESSTSICEVSNAIPAPAIEIHIGKALLFDIQQTDLFNRSSNTFTSTAKVTETYKLWTGKEICCTRKSIVGFGIADHSICKNISIKCDPTLYLNTTSPVDVPPDTTVVVKCTVLDECNANGQYTLWWEDGESTVIKTCNKTDECMLTLNYAGDGERILFCKIINSETKSLTVLSSGKKGSQSNEKDIQTLFSTFRFQVNNVLIGTAVFCGLCILFVIGRCIFLKRRKDNAVNTIEIVENHSDMASDSGVLHIETEGVQYAVVQRQASTQRIETQASHSLPCEQPRVDDGLAYAEYDITFLQEVKARVPARRTNTPTEYADIEFYPTQEPALEDPISHNASTLC